MMNEFTKALADTALDHDGWMSDGQDARLRLEDLTIHFCGEGSIDLRHIDEIARRIYGGPEDE